jgi:hypothetical protein
MKSSPYFVLLKLLVQTGCLGNNFFVLVLFGIGLGLVVEYSLFGRTGKT